MWFKWKNLRALGHILTYETEEPEKLFDGTLYQVLRNQGKFNAKLPLQRYPFDTQRISSSPSRPRPPTTPRWYSSPTAGPSR